MDAPYLYSGLEARLYDRLDELSDFDDLPFYEWFVQASPGPVLDLGCGTGRIMRPLLENGVEVVGVDSSELMLDLCRAALRERGLHAELRQGDMRQFDVGSGRFGTVMAPGYSAQLLVEEADLSRCLECCRRHLGDGGQLILPTYMPWEMIWSGCDSKPLEERRAVENAETGERFVAFQGWRLEAREQRLHLQNRYESRDRQGRLLAAEEKEMTLRWYVPHEMMQLLEKAGFSDVSLYGDFDFEAPDDESESIIYVAR